MGVHGLWQLLQPAGRPVSLESLEGKVLAVDVSIWLHQTMKGMRDKDGNPLPNAHLQGLFSRVCKLLFYRIKPVFVFDGGVPVLKKKTLAARRDRREEAERESSAVAEKLLENLVKSHAVKEVLGGGSQRAAGVSSPLKAKPGRVPGVRKGRNQKLEDIFELAPLPESEETNLVTAAQQWEQDFEKQENWIKEGLAALSDTHPDAEEFKSLPGEIQHEILRELKERKKYHSLSHLTKMPEDSQDFSSYQLKCLMKNCRLTTRMEEIRKEMTNQTAIDITAQYTGEDCDKVKSQFGDQVEARRIVSEDASHYVLIKGISSDGQMKQADKYHIEQTVKVEEVDSDPDTNPHATDEKRYNSPDKTRKTSVKIVSADESDSDIETVVARRFRRKGKSKAWAAKRNTRGLDRGKITEALKVKEEKLQPNETKKGNQVIESSSSSEDEGFIEVTLDADGPAEEDELFPASIFERPTQGHAETSDIFTWVNEESGRLAKKGTKYKIKQTPVPVQELVVKNQNAAKDDESSDDVEIGKVNSNKPQNAVSKSKDSVKTVASLVKENAQEKKDSDAAANKRKSVLSDILGQLKEKKKKLEEEVGEFDDMEDVPSEVISDEKSADPFSTSGSKVIFDQEADVEEMGGGFIPEDSSEEDTSILTDQDQGLAGTATGSKSETLAENFMSHESSHCEGGTSLDSESDEDLKLAKELSLQTDQTQEKPSEEDSEFDADLKLAIKLSMEASKSEEMRPSNSKTSGKSKEKDTTILPLSPYHSKTLVSEEDSDGFEEVTEIEGLTIEQSKKPRYDESKKPRYDEVNNVGSSISQIRQPVEDTDQRRLQPEDFEVDDTDRTEYVGPMTEHDLRDMRDELESERSALILQQGQRNRMATSVTEQINLDAQDLLRLFGIPYIVSPLEAEAQCAFLEAAGLTEGTITDDSDFWLFGGQRMYKNFFNQSKHVELYTMDNIHNHFSLSRQQLINIALLCGSDYTEGLQGVGPVRALEIMAEFPGTGLEGLYKFRQWWDKAKKTPGSLVVENKIRARLRNLTLISGFPSEAVVEAYMNPTVDESTESFSWAGPDLDMLRDFCKFKFGWAKDKSDQTLVPMFKEWSKTQSQGRISSYFGPEAFVQTSKIKSDRLRKALEMVKHPSSDPQAEGERATTVTTSDKGRKKQKEQKKKIKRIDTEEVEDAGKVDESGTTDDISKDKRRSKKVSFADNFEEYSEEVGCSEGTSNQEETGNNDFMLKMSEKVSQANKELDRMKQARNFACAAPNRGKAAADKGRKSTGRGRGGTTIKQGKAKPGNSIPISLDIPKRSAASRRGRSAAGGRAGSSKQSRAVNLSESSSSDSSDEEVSRVNNQQGKNVKMRKLAEKQIGSVTEKTQQKAEQRIVTETGKAQQKIKVATAAKSKSRKANLDEGHGGKNRSSTLRNEDSVSPETQPGDINPIKHQGSATTSPKKSDMPGSDIYPHEINEEGSRQIKYLGQNLKANATGNSTKAPKGSNSSDRAGEKSKSDTVVELAISNETKRKEQRGEGNGEEKEREILEVDKEGATKPSVEADTESIDMSKADVSVINRRNMPSTMAYLNQRSRQDRMLLHQISGKRLRNAVEMRMEQEEKRQPLDLERVKRKEEHEETTEQEDENDVVPGLSFEDALFGGDADSIASPRVKKRKVNTSGKDRPAKTANTMGNSNAKVATQNTSLFNEQRSKPSESTNKILKNTKISTKQSNILMNGKNTPDTQMRLKEEGSERKRSANSDEVKKSIGTEKTKSAASANRKETKEKEDFEPIFDVESCRLEASDVEPFFDVESRSLEERSVGEVKNLKTKSKRSRAFDKPIMAEDSCDESPPSSQGRKFKNQLKHLHEPRSVKGHGPLYVLAPGQEVSARAFAGKGKGRGKNRTSAGVNETSGGFVTAEERAQYENLTLDDLGSDFSDGDF